MIIKVVAAEISKGARRKLDPVEAVLGKAMT